MSHWLTLISVCSLALAGASALVILADIFALGNRQHMWIMNIVWPVTALYSGPLCLWLYFKYGRLLTERKKQAVKRPFWAQAAVAATHCGSGCTLGDIGAEWFMYFVPLTLFGMHIFAGWVLNYILAFLFGVAFQYFTIKPMKNLSPVQGVVAALKADTLSLTAWQLGMYGWMAVATFLIFGYELEKTTPVFWLQMQIALLAGFATSFPVNWWLIRRGIKEAM